MYNDNIKELKNQVGIYSITNKINDKTYIGQSKDMGGRKLEHIRDLKSNRHVNWHLQRAYNKYGVENFEFNVIEMCDERNLTDREKYYIDKFKTLNKHKGYNLKTVTDRVIYSELTIKKMSRSQKELRKNKGVRRKMAWSRSELTVEEVREIKTLLYHDMPIQDIVEEMSVTYNQVRHIRDNNSFTFVLPEYNYYIKNRETIHEKRRVKTVIRLYREGMSFEDIGKEIGTSYATPYRIIGKYANKHDERCRQTSIDYTYKKRERLIKTLSSMGYSGMGISEKLRIAKGIVYDTINGKCKPEIRNTLIDVYKYKSSKS